MNRLFQSSLLFVSVLFILGCKKEQPPISVTLNADDGGVLGWYNFSATSVNIDNNTASYFWDFGDGQTAITPNNLTVHQYLRNDNYSVTVTVRTKDGRSAIDSKRINIQSVPTTGQATFYTTVKNTGGSINVKIEGVSRGNITVYYTSSDPIVDCGASGNVTVTLPGGTYNYSALSQDWLKSWKGTITIINGQCSKMNLIN